MKERLFSLDLLRGLDMFLLKARCRGGSGTDGPAGPTGDTSSRALGWALVPVVPCIKQIYTASFTLQAMGWCELALAVLFVVCDIWKVRRGFSPVLLFGQLALTAYFVSHFFGPALTAGAHSCADGLLSWLPKSAAPFVLRLFVTAELVAVMVIWRKAKRA